jgi:hypothetical protein
MLPAFTPTCVSAGFVVKTALQADTRTRFYQAMTCQRIAHCFLTFEQEDEKYAVVINRQRGSFLVPYKRYEWLVSQQKRIPDFKTIDLGIAPVSISQMSWFIDRPEFKMSSFKENIYWLLVGRFFSKTYVPMTCALAISYILRMCGYKNNLHVAPHTLYKELENGIDNHFWRSKGWKNNFGKPISEASV